MSLDEIIAGINPIGIAPGLFASALSLFNWWKMRRPANLSVSPLIKYGVIYSRHNEATKLILPFIIHNNGAKRGLVKEVRFGFKTNQGVKFIPLMASSLSAL